jgi:hypothetical protein
VTVGGEVFRPVAGTEGVWLVTVDGRVGRRLDDGSIREVDCERGALDRRRRVRIRVDGKLSRVRVLDLVAAAWLSPDESGRLPAGCSVRIRPGIVDPTGSDFAGFLTITDAHGRSRVSEEGALLHRETDEAMAVVGRLIEIEEQVKHQQGAGGSGVVDGLSGLEGTEGLNDATKEDVTQ